MYLLTMFWITKFTNRQLLLLEHQTTDEHGQVYTENICIANKWWNIHLQLACTITKPKIWGSVGQARNFGFSRTTN